MRQVYTGLCFIQSSVQTGLYRIVFYSGFGSDRFIQDLFYSWFGSDRFIQDPFYSGFGSDRFIPDSFLFRVRFRLIYTGICFIQGSVKTGLYRILFYSGFGSDRFIQDPVLCRVRFKQVYTKFYFIQGLA